MLSLIFCIIIVSVVCVVYKEESNSSLLIFMFYELEYFFDIDFFLILIWIKMNVLNSFEEMKLKKIIKG